MTALRFTVSGTRESLVLLPNVGDEIACPVDGGRDWFVLGTFVSAKFDKETSSVALVLELPDGIEACVVEPPRRPDGCG